MKDRTAPAFGSHPLKEWLDCADSFCELVSTLDPEAVRGASGWGHELPNGLLSDGDTFLRAAGVTTERFSRVAEAYVLDIETEPFQVLTFSVEAGDTFMDSLVALLRIQRIPSAGREPQAKLQFVPIGLNQRMSEPLLFGAEARIELFTPILEFADMKPGVRLTYEVTRQKALKAFATVLQQSRVQKLWEVVGGFDVETYILLTKNDAQDSIEDSWKTSDDPDGQRLLKFCRKASRLSDDETRDWPPYLRLTCLLDAASAEEDFERYFAAICALTTCIVGPSGGWAEILEPH